MTIFRQAILGLTTIIGLIGSPHQSFAQEAMRGLSEAGKAKLQVILEAAKKEGKLSLVLGEGSLGGSGSSLGKDFNDYYGLNLDVRFTPGPAMPNVGATIIQQYQAKRPALTDVYTGYANHITTLLLANAAEKVDWSDWANNLQRADLIHADGAAIPITSSTPGIAYNSDVIKGNDIPKNFVDLLNPKFKGRVVTTPYASSFDRLATNEMWGKEKTMDFTRKLSKQVGGLMRCNEVDRIASGEFDIFGLTCSQSNALRPTNKSAPIGFVLANDAPIVMYLYHAIPANSAHPNAARLWLNFILSRPAQKELYESDSQDLHLLEGSKTGELVKAMEAKGTKFLMVDINFYKNHNAKDMDTDLQDIQKILRGDQ